MFADSREKKMLAQRNKDTPESDIQSYEDYKKQQDEDSYLGSKVAGETLDKIGSGASKVVDVFKDLLKEGWYRARTNRFAPNREKIIREKMQGTYKGDE